MNAHEFVCEHLFPGCTATIEADSEEEVARLAAEHMRGHHDADPHRHPDLNTEMWRAIVRLRS